MKKNIEIYSACNNWKSDISVLDMYVKILVMTDISGDYISNLLFNTLFNVVISAQ